MVSGAGVILGTPAYMAPEQVKGAETTAAADIYALGVVMYEMICGTQPFIADTPIATAIKRLEESDKLNLCSTRTCGVQLQRFPE